MGITCCDEDELMVNDSSLTDPVRSVPDVSFLQGSHSNHIQSKIEWPNQIFNSHRAIEPVLKSHTGIVHYIMKTNKIIVSNLKH